MKFLRFSRRWSLFLASLFVIQLLTNGVVTTQIVQARAKTTELKQQQIQQQGLETITWSVRGACGMCKRRIEKVVEGAGLEQATWTAADEKLTLVFDPKSFDLEAAKKRILESGHEVEGEQSNAAAYDKLPACCQYNDPNNPHFQQAKPTGNNTVTWNVRGACGMCKRRIEKVVEGAGLEQATWTAADEKLILVFDPKSFDLAAAKKRILESGHEVEGEQANAAAYDKLPACCQYNDPNNPHFQQPTAEGNSVLVGVVMEENSRGDLHPLQGVNIHWTNAANIKTSSDKDGVFQIPYNAERKQLVLTFAGREPQTVEVEDTKDMLVVTLNSNSIGEVTISTRRASNYISGKAIGRTEILSSQELFKAACCDLSESFETNASVDVVNSDAVTGSKQIQMLGLSGIYTQLTVENLPGPRGLSAPLGLGSIAGSWIESIQISKGIGSVANGFEQMTGQINVELKKPEGEEQAFFNVYTNDMGRSDVNVNLFKRLSDKWAVGVLLHDNFSLNEHRSTSDNGFRDLPVGNIFSGVNRWRYEDGKGIIAQFGFKYHKDDRAGGQIDFDPDQHLNIGGGAERPYGIVLDMNRYEVFSKVGYLFPSNRQRSIGLQLSGVWYDQQSSYGERDYLANQKSLYANLIYQDVLVSLKHKYRTGISTQIDSYDERVRLQQPAALNYDRKEIIPGAFVEYTFSPDDKFDLVAGMRGDYHNELGWFFTPRVQARYQPFLHTTIRASTGRGQRTASIFAENSAILASARTLSIDPFNGKSYGYGLGPEVSWNTGLSLDQHFRIWGRDANLSFEYYRTDFIDQVVVDLENPRSVEIYNLKNSSFANSFQTEFRMTPLANLELRTAYRFFDVQTKYKGFNEYMDKALVAKHRGFMNLAYAWTKTGLNFDYTLNWTGKKRLPSTEANPIEYQMGDYSDGYWTMNAQISKVFGKTRPVHIYLGGENLSNYYQKTPILAANDPFGPYFDTSILWGPLSGRMFYAGIRVIIP